MVRKRGREWKRTKGKEKKGRGGEGRGKRSEGESGSERLRKDCLLKVMDKNVPRKMINWIHAQCFKPGAEVRSLPML